MELKDFAEVILFGTNIARDKLLEPKILTDDNSYQAIIAPTYPARPNELSFEKNKHKVKIPFPNREQLEIEKQRGYVLHFFANHELLAMEIMALVLLIFPNSPKKFRMGIAKTIIEEQKHMKLYMQRMKELGVEFGEIPVNDFFWNCMTNMKSPLDFVTHMSMTFEQANIDFALYYKNLMDKIQDYATADILNTVYLEEIGHVKHGVFWFEEFRDKNLSQWESYTSALKLPLTPNRAKGVIFDIAARKKAGLSEDYIKELSVFSSSKGRPPSLFYFNPCCEAEVARGTVGYCSKKSVQNLQEDCAPLMLFLTTKDDILITPQKPSIEFLQSIQNCGFSLPEWHNTTNALIEVQQDYLSGFSPWGWSPETIKLFSHLKNKFTGKNSFYNKIFDLTFFSDKIKPLFSKKEVSEIYIQLHRYFISQDIKDILLDASTYPRVAISLSEVKQHVDYFLKLKQDFKTIVVKAPFSSSGQNMLRVFNTEFDTNSVNWILGILKNQSEVVVEPWFDNALDLSFQFKIENKKSIFLGMTRFLTDKRGQYLGSVLGKKTEGLAPELTQFLYKKYSYFSNIESIFKELMIKITEQSLFKEYEGPIGVDAFVIRDSHSKYGYRLKFLSEINPRFTMGRVSLEIAKRVQTGAFAVWMHFRLQDILASGFLSLKEFTYTVQKQFPIVLTDDSKPLIKQGIIFTNDPAKARSVLTTLIVGKNVLEHFQKLTKLKSLTHIVK